MSDTSSNQKSVKLLWTGGWDSTFQLLQVLLTYHSSVTPFYLIDENRPSTGFEIRTIRRIKEHLFQEYPDTLQLLQPTQYSAVADIEPDDEITDAYRSITREKRMGKQYEWLARFCKQMSMSNMQLCIHRDDKAHSVIEKFVSEDRSGTYPVFRIDEKYQHQKENRLFCFFSFPMFDLTKLQMAEIAFAHGWKEIMEMTWFCHTPSRHRKPCGHCNPCRYTIEEGLGWRVPFGGRVAYMLQTKLALPLKTSARRLTRRFRTHVISTSAPRNAP